MITKEDFEESVLKDETNNEMEIYDCHSPGTLPYIYFTSLWIILV